MGIMLIHKMMEKLVFLILRVSLMSRGHTLNLYVPVLQGKSIMIVIAEICKKP